MILSGLDFSILDCHDFNITALSQVEVGLCWSQWSQHFWPPSCRLLEEKKNVCRETRPGNWGLHVFSMFQITDPGGSSLYLYLYARRVFALIRCSCVSQGFE